MTRQVIGKKDVAAGATAAADNNYGAEESSVLVQPRNVQVQKPDGYFDRFLKYIPCEILVVYVTICGMLGENANAIALWIVYCLCQVCVPIFLWKIGVRKRKQLFISFLSFYFWAVAYGGPFHTIDGYHATHNSYLLPLYTFFVPYFDEQDDDAEDETD